MQKDGEPLSTNVVRVDFGGRSAMVSDSSLTPAMRILNEKKRALFEQWLALGTVCVLFDARLQGVRVPDEFSQQGDLRLNFCHNFNLPDFNFNEAGVWGSLSFDSGEFFCQVSWTSVYGLQSIKMKQGAVWFESFPADYDQVKVLGFSEEMCETLTASVAEADELDTTMTSNVIELDFSRKKDGPKS